MNGRCGTCPVEADCGYEFKPTECAGMRKFKLKPPEPPEPPARGDKVKLTLTVEVDYDTRGESVDTLKALLLGAARRMYDEGGMSGVTQAWVEGWSANVEESE